MTGPTVLVDEAALVVAAGSGDERAMGRLYDAYARPLYGFGLRRLGEPQLAEEFVQRVMTKLWRSAHRYDASRSSVQTWVFTIARTVAVDVHRGRARWERPAPIPDTPDTGDDLDALLRAEAVRVALDRLSSEHREVLRLAYFDGLSQTAVAAHLRLPLGTVKSRTFYALKAFRLACDELEVEP